MDKGVDGPILRMASAFSVPAPVKVFFSVIFKESKWLAQGIALIEKRLNTTLEISSALPFNHTRYYDEEMGEGLQRVLAFACGLFPRVMLPFIKHLARSVEADLAEDGKRRVNIDPGFMTLEQVCLLTFKNYYHRFYLGYGVLAEITLIYRKGTYSPLQWTYPDYAEKELIRIFNEARPQFKTELAKGGWL